MPLHLRAIQLKLRGKMPILTLTVPIDLSVCIDYLCIESSTAPCAGMISLYSFLTLTKSVLSQRFLMIGLPEIPADSSGSTTVW